MSVLTVLVALSVISCSEDKTDTELTGKLINLQKRCLAGLSRADYDMVWKDIRAEVDRFLISDKAGEKPEFTTLIEECRLHYQTARNFWFRPEGSWANIPEETKNELFGRYPAMGRNVEDGGAIDQSDPEGINARAALEIIWNEAKKAAQKATALQ